MLRRPPAAVKHDGVEEPFSAKPRPRCRFDVYRAVKLTGPAHYVFGDVATGKDVASCKQPVHADCRVPLDVVELAEPMEERFRST